MGGLQNEKGNFPAQPQANPQGQYSIDMSTVTDTWIEHLKSITTLKSRKKIDKTTYPNPAHVETSKSPAVSDENSEPFNSELETMSEEKRK